jgi:leucyl/phenylalanyl-tRNA--protein transferase
LTLLRRLPWLDQESHDFPDPSTALREPNGLLAAGGDLHPERLLRAYQQGIFPWYSRDQPLLWWSPDPRMVLRPERLHISRSLQKVLRRGAFRVTSDQAFSAVIHRCAGPRRGSADTWLLPDMRAAYEHLHRLGYAHSVEVWRDDTLVGGLYGVALPGVFFGESMFSLVSDASKVALVSLCRMLPCSGYRLLDCQIASAHLQSLGAELLPRSQFFAQLPALSAILRPAPWPYNAAVLNHSSDP